jgi:DNA-binding response OmpR family regulator
MSAKRCLLLVDDDTSILSMLEGALESPAWRIETASDALAALMKARDLRPFLIITDMQMPLYGKGSDMLRALRLEKATATTPVIVLTGMDLKKVAPLMPENDQRVRLFNKPPDYDLLIATIKEMSGVDINSAQA